jgi:hypothetical protein
MVIHSRIEASFAIASHRMGGHGNDGKIMEPGIGANQPGRGQAIHHRHLNVHQHEIEWLRQNLIDGVAAVDCNGCPNAKIAEHWVGVAAHKIKLSRSLDDFAKRKKGFLP